jgi:hypothetical protein
VADVTDGIARYLAALDLLTYDPTGITGDTFVGTMPSTPDRAVALTLSWPATPESRDDSDTAALQIRVREGPDPRDSQRRCLALRDALHGLTDVELPDGTWLVLATAPRPSPMGADSSGRHEHVTTVALDVAAPTNP